MASRTQLDQNRPAPPVGYISKESAILFDVTHKDRYWLNPIGMSQLQTAVKKRANSVVINGREYDLTYGHIFHLPASNEDRECVKVKRSDGVMAPFAYVNISRVLAFDFEASEK